MADPLDLQALDGQPLDLPALEHRPLGSPERPYGAALDLVELLGFQPAALYHEQLPAGRAASARHAHSSKREAVLVLEGRLEVEVEGRRVPLGPQGALRFAPGAFHQVWNPGPEPASYLVLANDAPADRIRFGESDARALGRDSPVSSAGAADGERAT